jgi:hypothetical protein
MPGPVAKFDVRPEFRELAPMPPTVRYLAGPTERILQNQLPPRPDARSYTGSTAALAADAEFGEIIRLASCAGLDPSN